MNKNSRLKLTACAFICGLLLTSNLTLASVMDVTTGYNITPIEISSGIDTGFNYQGANKEITSLHNFSYKPTEGEISENIPTPVPAPAAAWLFGSGLLGLLGIGRKRKKR